MSKDMIRPLSGREILSLRRVALILGILTLVMAIQTVVIAYAAYRESQAEKTASAK